MRLYGEAVAVQIAGDYCSAADLGGNLELDLPREEGVSFNPRIARVVSLVIQECDVTDPAQLRIAVYSCVANDRISALPGDVASELASVRDASSGRPAWIQGISLALMLDRVRHLHMMTSAFEDKDAYLAQVRASPLLLPESGAPERLRSKVLHAVDLQVRRLADDREKVQG